MKTYTLETLNIWGGRIFTPLLEHIKQQSENVDIFCFQEMLTTADNIFYTRPTIDNLEKAKTSNNHAGRANLYAEFQKVLSGYISFFHSVQDNMDYLGKTDYDLHFGQAMFVRNNLSVLRSGDIFVYRQKNSYLEGDFQTVGRNIEYVETEINGKNFLICNFHGVHGNEKKDTPDRIKQAQNVKEFLDNYNGPKILCGDFNLLPDTETMGIMEKGMRNLIKDYKVTSTRNHYYEKPIPFADYILVSNDVEVKDFKVLEDVVSDHLPLQLEFY